MRPTLGALALRLTVSLIALSAQATPSARGPAFRLEVGPSIAGGTSTLVKKAVIVVRPLSCEPKAISITGTAEGIVNGARESIPLRLVALETPGIYAVPRVWEKGRWVLHLSGACAEPTAVAATLVPLAPGGFIRDSVQVLTRAATPADIDAALRGVTTATE